MDSIINFYSENTAVFILSIILFFVSSISIFDIRIIQWKRVGSLPRNHPELPRWVSIIHIFDWGIKITLLIINWKYGLIYIGILFVLKVLPVLETVGNFLMVPFKPESLKEYDRTGKLPDDYPFDYRETNNNTIGE